MIYNEQTIQKRRSSLRSRKKRIRSTAAVTVLRLLLMFFILGFAICGGFLYGSFRGIISSIPRDYNIKPKYSATIIYDDQDKEVQLLSDYSSNRIPVSYEQLPDNLKNAFIAIEDERFYEHNGVDFRGIARALINDITHRGSRQGASTITQQLIKNNVFDVGGETNQIARIVRKVQEQALALRTEQLNTKNTILTDYLNTINLGKGTLGVQSAAKYYFNKPVDKLSLSECAVLAGITKNPSILNPVDHPEDNNVRRELILGKMFELGFISDEEYTAALEDDVYTRISKTNTQQTKNSVYSYFTDALITQVVSDLQDQQGCSQAQAYNLLYRGGLRIHSTQSSSMQKAADSIINDKENYPVDTKYSMDYELRVLHPDGSEDIYTEKDVKKYFIKKKKDSDYTTLYSSKKELEKAAKTFSSHKVKEDDVIEFESVHYTLEPQVSYSLIDQSSGQIKVLVGGRGKKNDDLALNRATAFERQPGSTFKILSTYAPALDTGGMTLATVFDDAPYKYESGKSVHNFEKNRYRGLITIREAIRDSNNIVAVKALTELTPQVGYDFLIKLGFTTLVQNRAGKDGGMESDVNQALSLGGITDGVDNVELTAAYAAIANKGEYNRPVLYTTVEDSNGKILLKNKTESQQVMKESTAWLLTNAMEDVIKEGTGEEAQLNSSMAVAGKTGTTSNNYDYWFCGFTPYYTASIWTGYDYNTSFENDADYHKVIWAKIMDRIIQDEELSIRSFDSCDDIEMATICTKSGKLPVANICSHDPEKSMEKSEYFASGTVPKERCENHISMTICSETNMAAGKYCPKNLVSTKIYRVRPKGSSGQTDDSPYLLPAGFSRKKCTLHTEAWLEEQKKIEEEKKKKEALEKKKNKEKNKSNDDKTSNQPDPDYTFPDFSKIFNP
ncbi:MAG: transglycosylase domain-containing protein [Eubacterium sp.]|nr:transglycosylase domain-containing protein [Eubacterium sp.]